MADDRMQQHPPIGGQYAMAAIEEGRVTLPPKVLEGTDADDPVRSAVEFLPALQRDLDARDRAPIDLGTDVLILVAAQGKSDDLDAIALDRAEHCCAPATSDIEQGHPGLQIQLAEREVDLGQLGLFEGHV